MLADVLIIMDVNISTNVKSETMVNPIIRIVSASIRFSIVIIFKFSLQNADVKMTRMINWPICAHIEFARLAFVNYFRHVQFTEDIVLFLYARQTNDFLNDREEIFHWMNAVLIVLISNRHLIDSIICWTRIDFIFIDRKFIFSFFFQFKVTLDSRPPILKLYYFFSSHRNREKSPKKSKT